MCFLEKISLKFEPNKKVHFFQLLSLFFVAQTAEKGSLDEKNVCNASLLRAVVLKRIFETEVYLFV